MRKFLEILKKILMCIKDFFMFNLKIVYVLLFLLLLTVGIATCSIKTADKISRNINGDIDVIRIGDKIIENDDYISQLSMYLPDYDNDNFFVYLNNLKNINKDKIRDIFIDLDYVSFDSTQLEELLSVLKILKEEGSRIYAYSSSYGNGEYLLASIADVIAMPDTVTTNLSISGYYIPNIYYKGLLDKLGIEYTSYHTGNYKSMGQEYYRKNMSKDLKDHLTNIYDRVLDARLEPIAEFKNLDYSKFKKEVLDGKYVLLNPYEAIEYGLIDEAISREEFLEKYNLYNRLDLVDFKIKNNSSDNVIALFELEGGISEGGDIDLKLVKNYLASLEMMDNLKGLVIHINSGGGSAYISNLIYKELKKFKEEKSIPIYISMGSAAASGGYYISSVGDKIFADRLTITGSIGVVSLAVNLEKLMSNIDLNIDTISKGKYVGLLSPYKKMSKEEADKYMSTLEDIYEEFKTVVSDSRNIKMKDLENIAGGRIWLGEQAKDLGLVDEIGGVLDTIESLAYDLNIENDYKVKYIDKPINFKNNILEKFMTKMDLDSEQVKFLMFIKENNMKAMYFNEGIEKVEF